MSEIIRKLSVETGLYQSYVRTIMRTAPVRYKEYEIPKRQGGFRKIAQPAREVKLLQRALITILLSKLPIHESATAYITGKSILDNAKPHSGSGPIIKIDFKNFFPSIRGRDWQIYCRQSGCLQNEEDLILTTNLLFQKQKQLRSLRLAIGAPSSPILSNILLNEFDTLISNRLSNDKVSYTRYADDLTFSAPRAGYLNLVMKTVNATVRSIKSPSLELNYDKTVFATAKYRRSVTGLVLSNDGHISIGRDKKRAMRAKLHYARMGRLEQPHLIELSGMLAYINSVDPIFMVTLRQKYGNDFISHLQKQSPRETS
jgi:RNA-directed DNA polymerase